MGPAGPKGDRGPAGERGPQGPQGAAAVTDPELSETSGNAVRNSAVTKEINSLRDSVSHAGRIFAGDLGKLAVDGGGHIRLWTTDEFREAFGAEPKECFIAASNRASGSSGISLSSPRWNGEAVFVTQMSVKDGAVKPVPGDGVTKVTPVAYFVAAY